jgi:predicted phage baseplate assembly protein
MAIESPRLDDKTYNDLVEEALKRIPRYTPEWTDHNASDPGVTLIELFAYMTDVMLYRLNRVPERHYVKLMELLGMKLAEPQAAKSRITMWLSAPQPVDIMIQEGTEVATPRTENEDSVVFSTDHNFTIRVAELDHVLTSMRTGNKARTYKPQDVKKAAQGFQGRGFNIFQDKPQPNDAVYFGFHRDMTDHIIGLDVKVDRAAGAGIDPNNPPYIWEALSNREPVEWTPCEVDYDGTRAFNVPGIIRLFMPKMVEGRIEQAEGFWLRCRLLRTRDDEPQYQESPYFQRLQVASWGGVINITHANIVRNEVLGRSDGSPGQKFNVQNTPVLERNEDEYLLVRMDGDREETWQEVEDFSNSQEDDRHYTFDSTSGEIRLGPSMPQRDGSVKSYGTIPPKRALLMMHQYRYGGGTRGNLQTGAINTLKTSIPYIQRVSNRQPAIGGLDAESVDDAKIRLPGHLRTLERAVTAADFEFLAQKGAPGRVARAFALPVAAETSSRVNIFLVPQVKDPHRIISPQELALAPDVQEMVHEYLDERRLLTTKLEILEPQYYWIRVKVRFRTSKHYKNDRVEKAVNDRLYQYLNPIIGGPNGTGWPFGRDLVASDIIARLQDIPGIDFIRSVDLYWIQYKTGSSTEIEEIEGPRELIETVRHGLIASERHDVQADNA